MRTTTMLLVLASLACAVPTASAAPSALTVQLPEGPLAPDSAVLVNVTLTIEDFMCQEPHALVVALSTSSTEGVKATFERSNLTFQVPSRSYFVDSYSETLSVNLTVRALAAGQAEITASFAPDGDGPCFVPGGFEPSTVIVNAEVAAPSTPTSPTTAPDPAVNETPTGENETPTSPPADDDTPRDCGPDATCKPVGNYDAPQESADNDTPGASWLAILAVFAVAALVWRRRG